MSIEWKSVFSSNASEVGYDDETQVLYVKWAKGGKTSAYYDVPPDVAQTAMTTYSVGTYLREEVKGVYRHAYV